MSKVDESDDVLTVDNVWYACVLVGWWVECKVVPVENEGDRSV